MASGLIALLDDVAALAKVAAASLDDIAAHAGKAGAKAAGVVIDDAAVTPRYAVGFAADRELPIVGKIALGSLRNKIFFLLPGALALSAFAPWLVTPLLMLGGLYLCFEGAEKAIEALAPHAPADDDATPIIDAETFEREKVAGAIATDFILSAEIMAIALAAVADRPVWEQGVILAVVGLALTALVYGAVALIVKADDFGVRLARGRLGLTRALGRGLVKGMPPFLNLLSLVGTAAMIWVGGGILLHGLESFGLTAPIHWVHAASGAATRALGALGGFTAWATEAMAAGLLGLAVGAALIPLGHLLAKARAIFAAGSGD
jgi:predicted DNA repair protein MutK